MPQADLTVKATGYQWYWGYAYPDKKFEVQFADAAGQRAQGRPAAPARVDNPMVVPVNKTVRVLVTGADVIHSFAVPAFGMKIDAVPGR